MAQTGGEGRGRGNRLVGLPGQARTMPLRLPPIPHAGVDRRQFSDERRATHEVIDEQFLSPILLTFLLLYYIVLMNSNMTKSD
jgi:hypothetical protein